MKRAIPALILALLLAGTTSGRPPSKGVPVESWTPYDNPALHLASVAPATATPRDEAGPSSFLPTPTLHPPGDGATPQGASVSGQAFAASQLDARQFDCLDAIVMHESRWRVDALNRTSGAYGIPQALPASKMASAGADWRTNPVTQVRWMLGYVHGRYGSPCAAWAFWRAHGWY